MNMSGEKEFISVLNGPKDDALGLRRLGRWHFSIKADSPMGQAWTLDIGHFSIPVCTGILPVHPVEQRSALRTYECPHARCALPSFFSNSQEPTNILRSCKTQTYSAISWHVSVVITTPTVTPGDRSYRIHYRSSSKSFVGAEQKQTAFELAGAPSSLPEKPRYSS